ncbi:MAG: Hsp20 family protein [Candidatus Brocadiales bacterium]|nr:Hsp20 family protein [Candidatus Brocadiales bacterium]
MSRNLPGLFNTSDFNPFFNQSLGLDNIFNSLTEFEKPNNKYPPYNIVKGPFSYAIEMALAGWKMDEINIVIEKNVLTIEGYKPSDGLGEHDEFIHKGIANRAFKQQFTIGDRVTIDSANLNDGMLVVDMSVSIPDEEKPITIKIGNNDKLIEG